MSWNDDLEGPALNFAGSTGPFVRALAGPGTGKTYALVRRVARILEEGCPGDRILVVTFARTAAQDLLGALQRHQGASAGGVGARTLHSLCFEILRKERVPEADRRVPRILLTFESDLLLYDLEGAFGNIYDRRDLQQAFVAAWARLQTDEPGQPVEGLDQSFQDALLSALRWHRAMLIGEVVPLALSFLRHNPNAPERSAYDHVLVDEYQDLNRAEQVLVDLFASSGVLAIIGDDDQSIYGFKSANPDGIRTFADTHTHTEDVEFNECRRCPKHVVEMATALIKRNPGRVRSAFLPRPSNVDGQIHHVQWTSIEDEATGIADFIAKAVEGGVPPGDCLILAPVRDIGYAIRDTVRTRGIDIHSFFREEPLDTDRSQQALTLLTLLANPDDRVSLRAWLALGSSSRAVNSYRRLLGAARDRQCDVSEILRLLTSNDLVLPYTASAVERWKHLQAEIARLDPYRADLAALVDELLGDGTDPETTLLREIAAQATSESEDLTQFADAVRYRISQPDVPLETPYARVMSFHKSKGLTARLVVLAGLTCPGSLGHSIIESRPLSAGLLSCCSPS